MGLILCMFEVAYILSAPIIGATLKKVGRKNYIIIGYLIVVLGTVGFAALALVEDDSMFFWLAIVFRFF